MHIENHYDALIEKHRRIEASLTAEMQRPLPDSLALQRLKRRKLILKDEIESWERLLNAVRIKPMRQAGRLHA